MIEAAFVFPLVIIIAVTMLSMMVGIYGEAEGCAAQQMLLRQESGADSETADGGLQDASRLRTLAKTGQAAGGGASEITRDAEKEGFENAYRVLESKVSSGFSREGLISFSGGKSYKITESIMDEEAFVRYADAGRLL